MAIYRDEVAILRSRDVGEGDRIFTLFGKRRGKFNAIAKGVRKLSSRKRGHLETFNLCRVSCAEGRNLDLIVESEAYYCLETKELALPEFKRIGFLGKMLYDFLPEEVSEREIFREWEEYIQGEKTVCSTNRFAMSVLDRLGFLSPRLSESWLSDIESEKTLAEIQRFVEKVVTAA